LGSRGRIPEALRLQGRTLLGDKGQDTPRAVSSKAIRIANVQCATAIGFSMHPHLHTSDNKGEHSCRHSLSRVQPSKSPTILAIICHVTANLLPACEDVMNALEECHARGFMFRVIGGCTDAKTAVNKCLRVERLKRTEKNRVEAKIKNEKIKAAFAEIDANS